MGKGGNVPILEFNVTGQRIQRIDKAVPIAKNRNYFKAKFNFKSEEWNGIKTALFVQGGYSKSQVLDETDMCEVPWEFFDTNCTIRGYVSVYCGDLITTNKEFVTIYTSGYRESDASVPPTPDIYQQLIELQSETKEIAESVRKDADEGKFNGQPGKQGPIGKTGPKGDPGENATDEQVQNAVDTYMSNNPIKPVEIDKTLSVEGQAADAKATGDKILQYAIKNTASGEGIVNITDSANEKSQDIKLFGKSEQLSTTGKNLFDLEKAKKADSYETVSVGDNVYKAVVYNVSPNTDYTLSVALKKSGAISNLNIANTTSRFSLITSDIKSRTVNSLDSGLVYVFFSEGALESNIEVFDKQYFDIQLEIGKVRTTYEPYTGGQPSPSPEYPQEIKSVGKYNEDSGKYEVDVKITGKNLFDIPEISKGTSVKIDCNITKNIRISCHGKTANVSGSNSRISVISKDGTSAFLYDSDMVKGKTFIATEENPIIHISARDTHITTGKYTQIQIEYGSVTTSYEPYTEQTVQIALDKPLRGIGDYKDEITKDGIVRKISEPYELDITKIVDAGYWNTNTVMFAIRLGKKTKPYVENKQSIKCNILEDCALETGNIYNRSKECIAVGGNDLIFRVLRSRLKDTTNFETAKQSFLEYMADKKMIVQYALEDEITEPLPEGFEQLLNLQTHYPTKVISTDSGEVDAGIEATYVADTKNYIDNKFATMQANIINRYQMGVANLLSLLPDNVQAEMIENDTNKILESEVI